MAASDHLEQLVGSMTLEQLAALTDRSIEEIVELVQGTTVSSPSTRPKQTKASKKVAKTKGPSTVQEADTSSEEADNTDQLGLWAGGKAPKQAGGGKKDGVDTRTQAGREAFDQAVLQVVKGADGRISAPEIRAEVGGTPHQIRASLNRWIESNKVKFAGKARAMRYWAR